MINTVNPETSTARKRRREILSQKTKNVEELEISPITKKKCLKLITTDTDGAVKNTTVKKTVTKPKTKKPQMRYDPEVPMSKEEAAAWRKEQRRKRNRESAAASRQRQKDRISELEQELSEWKVKYEEALARIEKLEQLKQVNGMCTTVQSDLDLAASAAVSPCSSPRINPAQSCGLVSLQGSCSETDCSASISGDESHAADNHVESHLSEKITKPA